MGGGGVYKAYMEQWQAKPTVFMIMYVKTVVKQKRWQTVAPRLLQQVKSSQEHTN